MMTSLSSKLFQGLGASSSSIEADYLTLSVDSVQGIAHLVGSGVQLNERQCRDLSSKLVKTVENIQKLVPHSRALTVPFRPALKNFYGVSEKAKLLVDQCCETDWCRAAVFQVHNEEAFREILLEVGLRYNVIYELAEGIIRDLEWTLIHAEDLRQLSLFLPAAESEVLEDQETLKRSLEHVAGTSDDRNQCLAIYLLAKLKCISEERMNEDFGMPDALLWVNETEPQGTWKLQRVIGSGSGASCVCCYNWLDILCARKEFHCKVADDIFRREATILAQMNHPNIVKFFCCSNGPEKGQCFIAMELMEMSLDDLIESRGKTGQVFPIPIVLDIITQIARGVCYLHDLKIAHRDLKPLNVVVTKILVAHLEDNFCVKLVDFGMSKTKVQVSKSNTISIPGVGTTKYRAPEAFPQAHQVAQGVKRKVNWFQADAYSFAVTCAVLLSLKKPFEDVPGSKLYEELLRGLRPKLPRECPKDLAALLKECWAATPQQRPSFADICSRLEKCKFQEFVRGSSTFRSEALQRPLGYEYIETVLKKQSLVQSQCATTIPYDSDDTKRIILDEAYDIRQFAEELCQSNNEYSEDRQTTLDKKFVLQKKKTSNLFLTGMDYEDLFEKVGLWSRTKSSFAQVVSTDVVGALLFKNIRYRRYMQLQLKRKFKEFDVKPTMFPYNEVRAATRNFHKDMKLGQGSSRAVYKGVLSNGNVVAVKQLDNFHYFNYNTTQALAEFLNEVVLISGMRHKNLVNLKGCCLHEDQRLLVYEYVENFDVKQILLGTRKEMVTWPMRLKICLGIAHGLHYLHDLACPRVIHRNITASHVLLDRNLNPKITDFGFALLFLDERSHVLTIRGANSTGYLAPEYACLGQVSDKMDVYSFGVLCLEIISGRRNIDMTMPQEQVWLSEWAWHLHEENRLLELVDPTLHLTDEEVQDVQRVINVCLLCRQKEVERRPSMARVVSILQGDTPCEVLELR